MTIAATTSWTVSRAQSRWEPRQSTVDHTGFRELQVGLQTRHMGVSKEILERRELPREETPLICWAFLRYSGEYVRSFMWPPEQLKNEHSEEEENIASECTEPETDLLQGRTTHQTREGGAMRVPATFCHHCQNNNLMVTIAKKTDFNLKT